MTDIESYNQDVIAKLHSRRGAVATGGLPLLLLITGEPNRAPSE